jgi:hypothetical protein
MIKKLTISLVRKTTFDGPWTLTIDSVEQGEKYPNAPVLDCLTKCGTFDGSGPITNAIYFLPEALKSMGISEPLANPIEIDPRFKVAPEGDSKASDKSFNEAVNLHWSKKPEANQEPMGDDYALRQEESVKAIKHAIAHGPPDQTTK